MRYRSFMLLLLTGALLVACGGNQESKEEKAAQEESSNDKGLTISDGDTEINVDSEEMEDAINSLKDAFTTKKDGENVEVVDFRELKKLMPNRIAGMKQKSSTGEKTGMLGFKFATAKAKYEDGDQSLDMSITDVAGIGILTASMAAWTNMDMDRETESGYERTTQIDGHPAFEKWDGDRKRGELSVFVDERYIITIEGRNIAEKDLRKALDGINLNQLGRLQ